MKNFLNGFFKLDFNNTSIKSEIIAGFTTFITMVYIIIVNPDIMSDSGMDQDAIFVGTCLAAAIACIFDGFVCQLANRSCSRNGIKCLFYVYSGRANGL
jgi:AGZA family xanthine/uracil permease-like MFS transporter